MPWITENVAFAGAGISAETWNDVLGHGFTAIVNLRSEHQDTFTEPLPVAYLWLPTEDHTDPLPENLLLGAQFIDTSVKSGKRVLIHCKMGMHRSATMAVAYLLYTGLSKDAALRKLAENGPRLYGTEENHQTLDKFQKLLAERK